MKQSILLAILAFIFIYLIAAFISWDFNASHWDIALRGFVGLFGAMFSLIAFFINQSNK